MLKKNLRIIFSKYPQHCVQKSEFIQRLVPDNVQVRHIHLVFNNLQRRLFGFGETLEPILLPTDPECLWSSKSVATRDSKCAAKHILPVNY